jgi:parallel beta-helix repeat protein
LNPFLGPTHPVHASGPYVVDLTSDGPDSNLGDGICYEGVNGCSLRAAIQQASADGVITDITFADGLAGSTLLVEGTYGTIIWAGSLIVLNGETKNISISGQNLNAGQSILQIQGNYNSVLNLTFRNAPGDAIQVGDFAGVGYGNANQISGVTLLGNGAAGVSVHGTSDGGRSNAIIYSFIGAAAGATTCIAGNLGHGISIDQLAISTTVNTNLIACNAYDGVYVHGLGGYPGGVSIDNNTIGTNGAVDMGNGLDGIEVELTSGTHIAGNTISGNGFSGIWLDGATNAIIHSNIIGVSSDGYTAIGNDGCGVAITDGAAGNWVGSLVQYEGNIIGANGRSGVCIESGSTYNTLEANKIGVNGNVSLPNGEAGVAVLNSNYNAIGTNAAGIAQVISGNTREGIYVENSLGTLIDVSNLIGVADDGSTPLGNYLQGVMLNGASDTTLYAGLIAYNAGAGVAVVGNTALGNRIAPNEVRSNGGLPIDLGNDGATPNDPGDGDSGPNGLLNYPEITGGSGNTATGTVCNGCTVLVYQASGNPRAAGGGGTWVMTVVADAAGNWSAALPGGLTAADITTVACEAPCSSTSNTSEMSPRWGATVHRVFLPLVVRH